MDTLGAIAVRADAAGLPFLLIGGHALNALGVGRQTADIDLLVRDVDMEAWKTLLAALGYSIHHEHAAFVQFQPPDTTQWPVDLILVGKDTFGAMHKSGQTVGFGAGIEARIPSVRHLIALKLHALKQAGVLRELVDVPDIVALIEANKLDYAGGDFKELCLRYGDEKIYEQIARACRRRGSGS